MALPTPCVIVPKPVTTISLASSSPACFTPSSATLLVSELVSLSSVPLIASLAPETFIMPALAPAINAALRGSFPDITAPRPPAAAPIAICAARPRGPAAIAAAIGRRNAARLPIVPMPSLASLGPETQRIGPTEPSGLIVRSPSCRSHDALLPLVSLKCCANRAAATAPSSPSPLNRTLPLRSVTRTGPPRYWKVLGCCPGVLKPVFSPKLSVGAAMYVPGGGVFAAALRSASCSGVSCAGAAAVSTTEGASAGAATTGDPMPATGSASTVTGSTAGV